MKQLIVKNTLVNWVLQGLLYSLLGSAIITGIILLLMSGIWIEFSGVGGVVYFSGLGANSAAVMPMIATSDAADLTQALVVLSSRDHQGLLALFLLWRISLFFVFSTLLCALVLRLQQHAMATVLTVSSLVFIASQCLNQQVPQSLHSGYFAIVGLTLVVLIVAYSVVKRVQKRRQLAPSSQMLIAYASQSGTAKNVALKMAQSSQSACDIRSFSDLTPQCLLDYNRLFVVASTYGDGQAPEKSFGFSQALTQGQQQLSHLNYAVLALGDKAYPHFCAFGHHMAGLLNDKGAVAMRPVQEIDRGDASIIGNWWQHIGELLGWSATHIQHDWLNGVVVSNECLNTQRPHRPAHAITLEVNDAQYQAGDLLEIVTPTSIVDIDEKLLEFGLAPQTTVSLNGEHCQLNHALTQLEWTNQVANTAQALVDKLASIRPRVYSIASAPNDSHIRLLVRQLKKDDNSLGFSSSALCNAAANQSFNVAVREHDSFRLPSKETPIIMIGAGTGIAPFMSFLAQRALQNTNDSWLIFGEQYSSHDNYFNAELDEYMASKVLTRLDYAFSRDKQWLDDGNARYVGDVVRQQQRELYHWIYEKGAHLYVCGNKKGMGESVILALQHLLKGDYEGLKLANRIHLDLY